MLLLLQPLLQLPPHAPSQLANAPMHGGMHRKVVELSQAPTLRPHVPFPSPATANALQFPMVALVAFVVFARAVWAMPPASASAIPRRLPIPHAGPGTGRFA